MSASATSSDLRQLFLDGMSKAACTVSVVTTDGVAGRFGVTVSAMASVSADAPKPTLLVCIHQMSPAAKALIENGVFCVNVLRDDQSFVSDTFAGQLKTADGDKFSCTEWIEDAVGAPRAADALVAFSCRLISSEHVGTHHVLFGAVEDIVSAGPGSPLIYANRAYGTPARIARAAREPDQSAPPERLRLGVFHTFAPYVVPEMLERLTAAGRKIELKLLEGDQQSIVGGLKAGEIDLALLYDFNLSDDFAVERLAMLDPYVLLAERHPLAERASLSLAELSKHPLILLDAPPSGDYFVSLFSDQNLVPKIRLRSRSFEMVRGVVGRGSGYSLLATRPASNMSYDGRALTTRPLQDKTRPSHIALAKCSDSRPSRAADQFASVCRDFFREFKA